MHFTWIGMCDDRNFWKKVENQLRVVKKRKDDKDSPKINNTRSMFSLTCICLAVAIHIRHSIEFPKNSMKIFYCRRFHQTCSNVLNIESSPDMTWEELSVCQLTTIKHNLRFRKKYLSAWGSAWALVWCFWAQFGVFVKSTDVLFQIQLWALLPPVECINVFLCKFPWIHSTSPLASRTFRGMKMNYSRLGF